MFLPEVYKERRRLLAAGLRDRGIASGCVLLASHAESPMNYAGNCYPYRQDSNWLYFIGLNEPGMAAILDIAGGSSLLFGEEISMADMVWTGPRPGLAVLSGQAGMDGSRPLAKARDSLLEFSGASQPTLYLPSCRPETTRFLASLLGRSDDEIRRGFSVDLIRTIVRLREIKEEREVAELEKAVTVTAEMHTTLLSALRPGWSEADAAALVNCVALKRNCSLSFSTIATVRGEVLHNHERGSVCREGDVFLLDAGAEVPSGYAGDLTTTFPVGSRFSPERAELYRLLLEVFSASVACLRPGVRFLDVHLAAALRLARGLRDIGIMKGDPDEAVDSGAHALFFPHGLGHMIGLDVHDMEGLGEDFVGYSGRERSSQFGLGSLRLAKTLKPGMVHSVEPGIYFIPGLIDVWSAERRHGDFIDYDELVKWRDCGGMRIEEDWLVTAEGARRLGPPIDKSLKAIEAARSGV